MGGGHSKSNKKTETLRYGVHPMTLRSRPIGISTEESPNSSRGNEVSSELSFHSSEVLFASSVKKLRFLVSYWEIPR